MREIFFEEKLGETRRNSEGCEPHGQGWGASRTGRDRSDGSGERDGITPDSLTRQLPTTPKGDKLEKGD